MTSPAIAPAQPALRLPERQRLPPSEPRRLETSRAAGRLAMVVLALFSARLRWDRLDASGLYLDDAWVAISTRVNGIGDLFRIGYTSPGFVFFLVRPWAWLFGSTTASLQVLPFVLGVVGPPLCFAVARAWRIRFGPAVLAGVLLAVSPTHRSYSANLKQYTAETIATLLLLWGCSRVVAAPGNQRRWTALVIGCAAATAFSMSETVIVLGVLAATTIAAAHREHTRMPRRAMVAIGSYGLFAIFWYAVILRPHLNSALYSFWNSKFIDLSAGITTVPGQVVDRLHGLFTGFSAVDPWLTMVLIALAALVLLVGRPALGVAVVVPAGVAIILAAGRIAPIGTGRTDIYLYPTLALLASAGLDQVIRALPRRAAAPTGLATLAVGCLLLAAARPGLPPYPSENMLPLVRRVERERTTRDVTIIYPMASFAYGLYTRSPVHIRVDNRYPMSFFVEPEDPRTFVLPMYRHAPSRYAGSIEKMTRGARRVWLVGAHLWPDWHVIVKDLADEGFRITQHQETSQAILLLYTRS